MSRSEESLQMQDESESFQAGANSAIEILPLDFEDESSFLREPELQDFIQEPMGDVRKPLGPTLPQSRLPMATSGSGLHDAAERGDEKEVARLLSQGNIDVNERAGEHRAYRTPLHRAAGYGHENIVKVLLKAGADPEKRSSANRTPLHEACTGGHVKAVRELVQYVTDLDCMDNYGQAPAHLAAFNGEVECIKLLISYGCNATLEDKQGKTPAHLAAAKNHAAVLGLLIEEDIEVSATDDQGKTPAHCAATCGGLESLKVFVQNDIDVNCKDHSWCLPIHDAAAHDHLPCVKFLIMSRLAKQESRDNSGKTPLHMAAQQGATECVHWLLEHKASANIRDGTGATPLHCAASGAHLQCVSCLLKHGAELDSRTANHETPLDHAKRFGNPNAFHRAVDGEVVCKFCMAKQEQIEYDLAHQPTEVERNISQSESVIYVPPQPSRISAKLSEQRADKRRPGSGEATPGRTRRGKDVHLAKRDLSTKYFGEHLFSLPDEIRKSSSTHKKGTKQLYKRT